MSWQDITIALVQFIFGLALIPSIVKWKLPATSTTLLTAIGLSILGATFLILELWISVTGTWFVASGWWILTIQNLIRNRNGRKSGT